jgi:nucleotide-binding universal stress UspA family protein
MAAPIVHRWSKPSTILLATEFPVNEKAFAFALAEAAEFGSDLVLFHAYDDSAPPAPGTSLTPVSNCTRTRVEKLHFEPLLQRACNLGVPCKIVVRPGLPAEQILTFLRKRKIDRIIMGVHTPGPIGKLLVGSVAEDVLRSATVPVNTVGPEVVESAYRHFATRVVLCAVGMQLSDGVVANFAANLAATHKATLILQQVIPPQEAVEFLAGRNICQIEAALSAMVPLRLRRKLVVQTRVVLGDPIEELLYQGRSQHANLIVLGAQGASRFAAITRACIIYKVLAYAPCPVMTLSPIVLAEHCAGDDRLRSSGLSLAGVF